MEVNAAASYPNYPPLLPPLLPPGFAAVTLERRLNWLGLKEVCLHSRVECRVRASTQAQL